MVCWLKKALYGLKQTPQVWYDKFNTTLLNYDFARCQSDHSVFVYHTGDVILLVVYMDDMVLIETDTSSITALKAYNKLSI